MMTEKNQEYSFQPWLRQYDAHVKTHLTYPDKNLSDLFDEVSLDCPDRVFLIHHSESMSFREIKELVDRLSSNLMSLGLKKGERVALILPNCPQFVISYYAILKAGGVVVALNPNFRMPEYEFLLDDSKPVLVICQQKHLDELGSFFILNNSFQLIVSGFQAEKNYYKTAIKKGEHGSVEIHSFTELTDKKLSLKSKEYPAISCSDPAIFQYSGGTTGMPKAAIGLHRNIIANVLQFINWCKLQKKDEVILAAIPLYHVYGMVLAMNMGVLLGATIVLVDDPREIDFMLDQIESHQVSFFPGVPAMYHAINQNGRVQRGKANLMSIKACISGSYTLHVNIKREFEKFTGGKLIEGYGLSEAPTATHCNPLYGVNKEGSIGLPLPDVSCRVVDLVNGTEDVQPGQPGELIINAPQVMAGYFYNPEEEEQALQNGWLYTGDVVIMDQDGYFYIIDRKKSLIKVGGLQVWPNEIEKTINSHPKVLECAVGGIPEAVMGERIVAWVVNQEKVSIETEEIIAWCKDRLATYKIPAEIIFTSKLPKTGVGKILRRELIADYIKQNNTRIA